MDKEPDGGVQGSDEDSLEELPINTPAGVMNEFGPDEVHCAAKVFHKTIRKYNMKSLQLDQAEILKKLEQLVDQAKDDFSVSLSFDGETFFFTANHDWDERRGVDRENQV